MKKQLKRRVIAVAIAMVAVIAVSGVAYAWWSSGGSGDGSAQAGTVTSVIVNQTGTINTLYPGGPAQPIGGTLTNPNPGKVFITSVSATIISVSMLAGHGGTVDCTAADFLLVGTVVVGAEIPNGVTNWGHAATPPVDTMTIQLQNLTHDQDACKGATVNLLISAS
ncbi:MAG: hypothetical protein ABSE70_05490 [Candidatus Limnocylindrales bacterium]